jgi:predicted CopG family antitoxin
MEKTTIQISKNTLEKLQNLKRFERESYDEVINLVVDEYEEETLYPEEIEEIKIALENVRLGKTKSIEKVAEELGISLK